MRTHRLVLVAGAVAAYLGLVPFLPAQDVEKGTHHTGWKEWIDRLPAEEQVKLRAVRALAMQHRAVQAADAKRRRAEKRFHDVLRATMLKIDPTIQPILDKMPAPKKHRRQS
jgi:hypothetical protein